MSKHTGAYRTFFESPAGIAFREFLDISMSSYHTVAENEPDKARDYMQRAKGMRQVIDHINSVTAERKTDIKQN